MSLPAKLGLGAAQTRFDDLQMIHVLLTADGPIHGVGAFLPFHRYFVHIHESLLRSECNYAGAQPYWDESLDAGNFSHSVILDPESGFGGNGVGKDNCIVDGPFKDYVNSIGPGQTYGKHCINRAVDECMSQNAKKENIAGCMGKKTYVDAWNCIEGMPHSAGHGGIGGQVRTFLPLAYAGSQWTGMY